MPWYKFAKLSDTNEVVLYNDSISSSNDKENLHGALLLTEGLESRSGVGGKAPEAVEKFSRQQIAAVHRYIVDPKFWLPQWVRDHLDKGGTPETLVREIVDRVTKDPHHNTLLEAQFLLNEIGRDPVNFMTIRKWINREFIQKVIKTGRLNSK